MPLTGSGQIKLSDIRNEFGLGSGQIAMSSLHGKGNAAASGQIQMAANFYGTSNVSYLAQGSLTVGYVGANKGNQIYKGRWNGTPADNVVIGSVSSTSGSFGDAADYAAILDLNNSTYTDAWAIKYEHVDLGGFQINNTTVKRRSPDLYYANPGFVGLGNQYWRFNQSTSSISTNSSYTFNILKIGGTYGVSRTFTVVSFNTSTTNGKGVTTNFTNRGLASGQNSISGSFVNPENSNQSLTLTDCRARNDGTNTFLFSSSGINYTSGAHNNTAMTTSDYVSHHIRFLKLEKSDGSVLNIKLSRFSGNSYEMAGSNIGTGATSTFYSWLTNTVGTTITATLY